MTFDFLTKPQKIKIDYIIERVEEFFPIPSGAINASSTDMTKTNVMEGMFVENVEKGTPTTLMRNTRKFTDVQTVVDTIRCMQRLAKNGKERKRCCQ